MMDFLSKIKGAMGRLGGPDGGPPPDGADPGAQFSAPPQPGGADPSQLMAAMGGMGAAPPTGMPPQPNPMAQDVMNARREFRMGRMGGGAGGGGYTGMGGAGRPMME